MIGESTTGATGERVVTAGSRWVGSQSRASSSLLRTASLVSSRRTLRLSWNCWPTPLTAAQTTPTKAARSSKSAWGSGGVCQLRNVREIGSGFWTVNTSATAPSSPNSAKRKTMVPSPENVVPLGWLSRCSPLGAESRDNLIRGTGRLRRRDGHVLPQGVLGPWTHDSVDGSGIISGFREGFLKFSDVLRPRRARAANLRCLRILCESHLRRYRRKQNQHQTHDSSTCDVVMAHGDYLLAHAGCIVGASDPRDRVALTSWTVAE